jgi:hypothetical protein
MTTRAALLVFLLAGCGDSEPAIDSGSSSIDAPPGTIDGAPDPIDGGEVVADAAGPGATPAGILWPDFSLTDINPASPTYNTARSLVGARGKVLVVHMALFS